MAVEGDALWPEDATAQALVCVRASVPSSELFDRLFNKPEISAELHKERGDGNVKEGVWVSSREKLPQPQFAWEPSTEKIKPKAHLHWWRKVRFDSPPTAMSSKPFQNEELQHCRELVPNKRYTVEIKANTSAMYGDKFNIFFRYNICALSSNSCALTVSFFVEFLPSMNRMLKPVVSRAVDGGVKGTFKTFRKVLGGVVDCEDILETALLKELQLLDSEALPSAPAVPAEAAAEHVPVMPRAPSAEAPGHPHAPGPRNLVEFFSDQLVYQEQVDLLSEVVNSGLKYVSDKGYFARALGAALTIWLINVAVTICNALEGFCKSTSSRIFWLPCWPLTHLLDLPDSTNEVLSSLLLVAILNWGSVQGYELLAEHLRSSAATAASSSRAREPHTGLKVPTVGDEAFSNSESSKSRALAESSAEPKASATVVAPVRSAPPAKPFPESVKKMVREREAKEGAKSKAAAAAAASLAASATSEKATKKGCSRVVPVEDGAPAAAEAGGSTLDVLSPGSNSSAGGLKSPQSIEMGAMGASKARPQKAPASGLSPQGMSQVTTPQEADKQRGMNLLSAGDLSVPVATTVDNMGPLSPDSEQPSANPPQPPSMTREDGEGCFSEDGEKEGVLSPVSDKSTTWLDSMADSFRGPRVKHAESASVLPAHGPIPVRRTVTMLYDVMPASKRPNYVVGLCQEHSTVSHGLGNGAMGFLRHTDIVYEEIFENERFQPFRGWGHLWPGHFLPSDRVGHWSDRHGRPGGSASMDFEQVVPQLPSEEEWYWLDADWMLDLDGLESECVDAEGWTYALDFNFFKFPNMPGSGKCTMKHFVRRRRWIRARARIHQRSKVGTECVPSEDGTGKEQNPQSIDSSDEGGELVQEEVVEKAQARACASFDVAPRPAEEATRGSRYSHPRAKSETEASSMEEAGSNGHKERAKPEMNEGLSLGESSHVSEVADAEASKPKIEDALEPMASKPGGDDSSGSDGSNGRPPDAPSSASKRDSSEGEPDSANDALATPQPPSENLTSPKPESIPKTVEDAATPPAGQPTSSLKRHPLESGSSLSSLRSAAQQSTADVADAAVAASGKVESGTEVVSGEGSSVAPDDPPGGTSVGSDDDPPDASELSYSHPHPSTPTPNSMGASRMTSWTSWQDGAGVKLPDGSSPVSPALVTTPASEVIQVEGSMGSAAKVLGAGKSDSTTPAAAANAHQVQKQMQQGSHQGSQMEPAAMQHVQHDQAARVGGPSGSSKDNSKNSAASAAPGAAMGTRSSLGVVFASSEVDPDEGKQANSPGPHTSSSTSQEKGTAEPSNVARSPPSTLEVMNRDGSPAQQNSPNSVVPFQGGQTTYEPNDREASLEALQALVGQVDNAEPSRGAAGEPVKTPRKFRPPSAQVSQAPPTEVTASRSQGLIPPGCAAGVPQAPPKEITANRLPATIPPGGGPSAGFKGRRIAAPTPITASRD